MTPTEEDVFALDHMYRLESIYPLVVHSDFDDPVRKNFVDWMVGIHDDFGFQEDTLFSAVQMVDQYLTATTSLCVTNGLVLTWIAALLIASKIEEVRPLSIQECVKMSVDTFTREDILEEEQLLLREVNFCLTRPTSCRFATRFLERVDYINQLPVIRATGHVFA